MSVYGTFTPSSVEEYILPMIISIIEKYIRRLNVGVKQGKDVHRTERKDGKLIKLENKLHYKCHLRAPSAHWPY